MTAHDQNRELEQRLWRLQAGDHLCCLYASEEEHRTLLAPFMRQGLERHEKVLYIADDHTAGHIIAYLTSDGVEVKPYLQGGQLSVLSSDESYVHAGVFDPDRMIALLRSETERAAGQGYKALRVTGEMSWALKGLPGSERVVEYEAKLNTFSRAARAWPFASTTGAGSMRACCWRCWRLTPWPWSGPRSMTTSTTCPPRTSSGPTPSPPSWTAG